MQKLSYEEIQFLKFFFSRNHEILIERYTRSILIPRTGPSQKSVSKIHYQVRW